MATNLPFQAVELWTSAFYMATDPTSKARSKVRFYFESEVFCAATSKDITPYLATRRQTARVGPVPFVAIACISGDPEWFLDSISEVFPSPKSGPLLDILDVQKWERGTIVLPTIEKGLQCINFFMQYPIIEKANSDVKFCPVATRAYASRSSSPVVLMVCRDREVPERLQKQCVSTNWEIDKLSSAPSRIFTDLFEFVSEWPDVWRSARHELMKRNSELQGNTQKLDVLQLTRTLHNDTANVIALREDLRLHITAFQNYQFLVKRLIAKGSPFVATGDAEALESLEDRIEHCLQNLLHQQESSAVIHRQLENLLSLAFNTEMVSQGQAVGRLNTLAFAFLPLSYVATIFGMTNFSISAKWYPLGASIVLSLVLIWFIFTSQLPKWRLKDSWTRTTWKEHPKTIEGSKEDFVESDTRSRQKSVSAISPPTETSAANATRSPSIRVPNLQDQPTENSSNKLTLAQKFMFLFFRRYPELKSTNLSEMGPDSRRLTIMKPQPGYLSVGPGFQSHAEPGTSSWALPMEQLPTLAPPPPLPLGYGAFEPSSGARPLLHLPTSSGSRPSTSGSQVGSSGGNSREIPSRWV